MTTLRSSYESLLRNPSLPCGIRDADVDGPADAPLVPRTVANEKQIQEFCDTTLAEIFADECDFLDEHGNLCGPAKLLSFARIVADAWKAYADGKRIY